MKINVSLGKNSYSIHILQKDFKNSFDLIKKSLKEDRLFVITNTKIKKLYGKTIEKSAKPLNIDWLVIPDGEQHKNINTCDKLWLKLAKKNASRSSALLALGGGVVGDITGFVAATYMRGIDYYQMPTSLLAQVDSSVGGKTGIDLSLGKNLVGNFYQPKAVFIHTDFLKTLPKRELRCGLAEVIKYGMIWDSKFFEYLDKNQKKILSLNHQALCKIISTSCEIKATVVKKDEKEANIRAILNFGHTLGHAIETLTGYSKYKHGEAIAIGMVFATKLSHDLGYCPESKVDKLKALLKKYQLPISWPKLTKENYSTAMSRDKKSGGKNIKFILLQKVGKVGIVPLKVTEIVKHL